MDDIPDPEESERLRYLEYFQSALVREGTEGLLEEQKQWFQLNRSRLAAEYDAIARARGERVDALNNPFLQHRDRTKYDSVFSHEIFGPILSKSLKAAEKLGYSLRRPVTLANAPSVEPSPVGVPSTDIHLFFIGQGTYNFCNYWAKLFSAAIYRAGLIPANERTLDTLIAAIRSEPIILQALKLVLKYARSESLVGFGEIKQEQPLFNFRMLLVTAMETFIVGHELGHFILHERHPELNGIPPGQSARQVELLCDAIGFAICAAVGDADDNQVSKHLIGPLLLLYALKLNDDCQCMLLGIEQNVSETHPNLTERIRSLFKFSMTADPSGMLTKSMEEALGYALIVGTHVKSVLNSVRDGASSDA